MSNPFVKNKITTCIPPYFCKATPEIIAFKWDKYIQKVDSLKNTVLKNIINFDKILLHYDYIFDDLEMIENIDPVENLFYINVYFLEYYKGRFIQRHEKLFGKLQELRKLFQYEL